MARYLTPARIGIILLIEQYLDCQLPSTSRLKVLSIISSRILQVNNHDRLDGAEHLATVSELADKLFSSLSGLPSDVPGRTVYDGLLQRIWRLDNMDSLFAMFERLTEETSPPAIFPVPQQRLYSRASPFGQFVRRCCVEFTRLQFADSQALWTAFQSWRAPTHHVWAQRNPEAAEQLSENVQIAETALPLFSEPISSPQLLSSAEDANNLITFSIHCLQKFGSRIPDDMKAKLQTWLTGQQDAGVQSLQHFLAFFEHWKAGQYTMALESLHRYFDYSLVARTTSSGNENMRIYYQYALLHLSVLHADFDCWEESVDAMDECISTARENQDTACLNFALSWLLYLRQAKPATGTAAFGSISRMLGGVMGEQDEINFLKAKARETKHWSLLSSTLLEEAKLEMYTSGSTSKAVEHVTQAAYISVQHDLRTLMPAASMFESAAYDRLGQHHLANRNQETVRYAYGSCAPAGDRVRALCRTAYTTTQNGKCAAGLKILEEAMPQARGSLKLEQRVQAFVILVQLLRSLKRDDVHTALYFMSQLQPIRGLGDAEIEFEIDVLEIVLLVKQRELGQAMTKINAHLKRLQQSPFAEISQRLHYMILKARIFASSASASKGFSVCLRAASTASRLRLFPQLLDAIVVLARIMNELSAFDAARQLLQAALPKMIEARQTSLTAEAFVVLGETHVGTAGNGCAAGSAEQMQNVRLAEGFVDRGREIYARLEDTDGQLDCLAMKVRLAEVRDDENSATQAESLYGLLLASKEERELA